MATTTNASDGDGPPASLEDWSRVLELWGELDTVVEDRRCQVCGQRAVQCHAPCPRQLLGTARAMFGRVYTDPHTLPSQAVLQDMDAELRAVSERAVDLLNLASRARRMVEALRSHPLRSRSTSPPAGGNQP